MYRNDKNLFNKFPPMSRH